MTAVPLGVRRFDIGRVVERTFGVASRNFVAFYLLTLLLSSLPNIVLAWLMLGYRGGALSSATILIALVTGLVSLVTSLLVQGALVWGTITDLNGKKATVGELLAHGLSCALPILGISIVFTFALMFGFLFLLVPGLILLVMWSVVIPVTVVERTPGLGAFSRSAALTRDVRWAIFGLMVIYMIGAMVLGATLGAVGFLVSSVFLKLVLNSLINSVAVLIGSIGGAVLYSELRASKEGIQPDALAAVFD